MTLSRKGRLAQLSRRLADLEEEIRLVREELSYHEHLADDAARDAAVYDDPIERENAKLTASDARRFRERLARLNRRKARLQAKHQRLARSN